MSEREWNYAQAAAVVLTTEGQAGRVYELAGDESYTLSDLAHVIATAAGTPVGVNNKCSYCIMHSETNPTKTLGHLEESTLPASESERAPRSTRTRIRRVTAPDCAIPGLCGSTRDLTEQMTAL